MTIPVLRALLLATALDVGASNDGSLSVPPQHPLHWTMPCTGVLRVEERGQDLLLTHAGQQFDIVLSVPRYGYWLGVVEADSALELQGLGPGTGTVRLAPSCVGPETADVRPELAWFARAQALAQHLQDASPEAALPASAQMQDLLADAPDASSRIHAQFLIGQRANRLGDHRGAEAAYRAAQAEASAEGDAVQAGLADLGLTLALRMRSQFEPVLDLAERAAAALPRTDAYYQARALEERCLALHSLHRLPDARECYARVARAHADRAERDAELNTRYNEAFVLRDLGDRPAALAVLERAELRAADPQVRARTRGLLALLRGMLARETGQIATALAALERAAHWFAQAPEQGPHWRASALVRVAEIYGQLGLSELAYRQLEQALRGYRAQDTPGRIAGALMKLAAIERAQLAPERAARWFAAAGRVYANLGLAMEFAEAELGRLENSLPKDRDAALAQLQASPAVFDALSAAERPRYLLLRARWLLLAERWTPARQMLDAVHATPLSPPVRTEALVLDAQLLARTDVAAALELLATAVRRTHAEAPPGVLGFLGLRGLRELRATWTQLALHAATPRPPAAQWWEIARDSVATQALALSSAPPGASKRVSFGSVIRADMLRGSGLADLTTPSALLGRLTQSDAAQSTVALSRVHAPTLAQLQAALPAGTWLLLLLPAEPQSAALWISPDRAEVRALSGARVLQSASARLQSAISQRESSVAKVLQAADALAALLFVDPPQTEAPAALWVLADDSYTSLPLAALRWPGADDVLLETTASTWISALVPKQPHPVTADVYSFMADFREAGPTSATLPPLWAAAGEPEWIRSALAPQPVRVIEQQDFTLAALRAALGQHGAWVHIASHGSAHTGRIGHSGLWLPPQSAEGPQFVSWLDLLETPLAAELLVLNACELGAAPSDARQANVSFAMAVSAAGIAQVVAAHWAISDVASAQWVPDFYAALDRDPTHDSAQALRHAQLTLKHSRAFRHPYTWASLGHFRRLEY